MRLFHALLLIPLFTAPAFAETAAPPAAGSHARRGAEQHFADANTSHDGRLTLDQAKLGFKSIARSFAQIDVNRRGYVTLDDIRAWKAAKKAARQAAKQGGVPPAAAAAPRQGPRAAAPSEDRMVPIQVEGPRIGVDVPKTPLNGPRST